MRVNSEDAIIILDTLQKMISKAYAETDITKVVRKPGASPLVTGLIVRDLIKLRKHAEMVFTGVSL